MLDWEDFAEEVVGEMRGAPRDKWVCRTFPHRLAQDLKEELRDQIREGVIQTGQACLQWLEDEERVDAPNREIGGFVVHSAAAGARGAEGPGMESVHPKVPKKAQAGGGLE